MQTNVVAFLSIEKSKNGAVLTAGAKARFSRRISAQTTTDRSSNAADISYTMEMGGNKEQGVVE